MRYRLRDGVKVRKEDFGLLFYCQEGPRVIFVGCGRILPLDFFEGKKTLKDIINSSMVETSPHLIQELFKTIRFLLEERIIIKSDSY